MAYENGSPAKVLYILWNCAELSKQKYRFSKSGIFVYL
jgi:hypothetical protein